MKRPRSTFGLTLLIVLGVALASVGIILHLALPAQYERVELIPIIVGFAMAVFGALWLDPERGKLAVKGVTDAAGEVVHSVVELRTGKGRKDPVIRVEKTTPADDPDASPEVKVTVTQGSSDPATPPAEPLVNPVQWKDGHDEGVL